METAVEKKPRVQRKVKETTIQNEFVKGRQGHKHTVVERLDFRGESKRIKTVVYVDAYDFQSYCRTYLWDGTDWHIVSSVHYTKMTSVVQKTRLYVVDTNKVPQTIVWDHHTVRRAALAIIFDY